MNGGKEGGRGEGREGGKKRKEGRSKIERYHLINLVFEFRSHSYFFL